MLPKLMHLFVHLQEIINYTVIVRLRVICHGPLGCMFWQVREVYHTICIEKNITCLGILVGNSGWAKVISLYVWYWIAQLKALGEIGNAGWAAPLDTTWTNSNSKWRVLVVETVMTLQLMLWACTAGGRMVRFRGCGNFLWVAYWSKSSSNYNSDIYGA